MTGSGGAGFQGYTLNYEAGQFGGPATNRILNVNGTLPYTYDAAGNLTAAEGRNYAYDGASRLTSVNSGTLGQYGYDGDGMRVKKVEGGGATYYVRSSVLGQALMEVTSAGVQRAYVYAPNGKLLAQRSTDGQFYWVHTDHLGSGRKLTDASGVVIYRAEFDPHGQVLLEWAASGNTNLNTKKFATYERDAGTGLDYAMARMYQPQRGRFMQPDPAWLRAASLARPQSLNRYSYVENDPVNFIDPSGNNLIGAFGAFVNVGGLLVPNVGTVATINTSTNAGMMGIPGSTAIVAVEEWVDGSVGIVGGGGDIGMLAEQRQLQADLANALRGLSSNCKEELFGAADVNNLANSAQGIDGVTIAKVDGTYFQERIPNSGLASQTFAQYWSQNGSGAVAVTVAFNFDGDNTDAGKYRSFILGPGYSDPSRYDPHGLADAGNDLNFYQQNVLVHEYYHIYTNRTDQGIFDDLNLGGKGYSGDPSLAFKDFLNKGCFPK